VALGAALNVQIGQKSKILFRNRERLNLYQNDRRNLLTQNKYEYINFQSLGGAQGRSKGLNRPKIEIFIS